MRVPGVVAMATAAVLIGACGPVGQETESGSGASEGAAETSTFGPEEITFGASLAQIRGHHAVAADLLAAGDQESALVHARHPIEEILPAVAGELEEHGAGDAAADLETALDDAVRAVETGSSTADAEEAFRSAGEATVEAESALVGTASDVEGYDSSVLAALLSTAAHEYEESVRGTRIAVVEEYEDAFGFLSEGQSMYEDLEGAVRDVAIEEAEEIAEGFEVLEQALPAPAPPPRAVPVEDVEGAAELIGHELEETVGAQVLTAAEPEEVGHEIRSLLDQVVASYRAGDEAEASELAAEAYLQNYEVIEADVIEQAPEVNEELEPLLGADLRARIRAGAPPSEIEDMTRRAKVLLDQAIAAVEEE